MLHVHGVVHRLREAAGDRLCDSKNTIQSLGAEEGIVNEVVPHPVDVRIDHQRVDESENQHDPKRRVREKKVECEEVSEVKQAGERGKGVPSRMREQPGICCRPFYSNNFGIHLRKLGVLKLRYTKVDWQVLKIAKAIATRLS